MTHFTFYFGGVVAAGLICLGFRPVAVLYGILLFGAFEFVVRTFLL